MLSRGDIYNAAENIPDINTVIRVPLLLLDDAYTWQYDVSSLIVMWAKAVSWEMNLRLTH